MKFQQPIKISIPVHCHENWEKMTAKEQGRHCAVCDKVVVDFANTLDEEVLNYLQKNSGRICGIVNSEQLDKPFLKIPKKMKVFLYSLVVIFILSVSEVATAQTFSTTDTIQTHQSGEIHGRVINEKGEGLNFASVTIYQNGVVKGGAKTDLNGNFKLRYLIPGKYVLNASLTGYEKFINEDLIIYNNTNLPLEIMMKMKKDIKLQGDVIIIHRLIRPLDPSAPNRKIINEEQIKHFPK